MHPATTAIAMNTQDTVAAEPSIATIKLHPDKTGTTVEVRHTNIPDEAYENINEGWREYYIGAIKHFCEDDE